MSLGSALLTLIAVTAFNQTCRAQSNGSDVATRPASAPCSFQGGGDSGGVWRLRQRVCAAGLQPLQLEVPASDSGDSPHVTVEGAAAAGGGDQAAAEAPAAAGVWSTVWSGPAGNSSLLDARAIAGQPIRLGLRDITCAGCLDPAGTTLQQLLLPSVLIAPVPAAALSNVLVAGLGLGQQQGEALVSRVLALQPIQQITSGWSLVVYTDGATYIVIPRLQVPALVVNTSGAFITAAPQPPAPQVRRRLTALGPPPGPPPGQSTSNASAAAAPLPADLAGPNFFPDVTNDTFHQILAQHGSLNTTAPLLLLVTSNVTVAPHPGLPRGGFSVARPVVILGRDRAVTSLDFGGKVNIIRLIGAGNMTFDSLALDNLFPGDEESIRNVSGLSATLAYAVYAVKWNREDRRLFIVRCTLAVPEQMQIERLKYYFAIFNSADPELRKQGEWMRSGPTGPQAIIAQISVDQRPGLAIQLFTNKAITYKDVFVQSHNVVAPKVELRPGDSVFMDAEAIAAAVGSPLHVPPITAMLYGPQDLTARMPLVRPTTIFVVPPQGADLSPEAAIGWPPPGGLVVTPGPVPNSLIFFGDIATQNSTGNGTASGQAAAKGPVPDPGAHPGSTLYHPLWLGYAVNLVTVPPKSQESVQLRGLTLVELGQGPAAGSADSLQNPDVWTHLVWAINSTLDEPRMLLDSCQLMLPAPELRYIRSLVAAQGPDLDVPLLGARTLAFRGAKLAPDGSVAIDNYSGPGLQATWLTLTEDRAPLPPGYAWPCNAAGDMQAAVRLPPWAVALVALGCAAAVLLPAASLLWRRQRRRHRRQLLSAGASRRSSKLASTAGSLAYAGAGPLGGGGGGDDTVAQRDARRTLAAAKVAAEGDVESGVRAMGDPENGTAVAVLVQGGAAGGSATSPSAATDVEGRWQALSWKIGKRIGRIHMHKLTSAMGDAAPQPADAAGGSSHGPRTSAETAAGGSVAGGSAAHARSRPSERGSECPSLDLQLQSPIGQGSFGTVWRGVLQGRTEVAVKLMQLPDLSSLGPAGAHAAATIRERMVVQEAAIASAVAHPHVVSVFSVGLRPCRPPQQQPPSASAQQQGRHLTPDLLPQIMAQPHPGAAPEGGSGPVLWQLTIVMEYCDQGTLRQALDRGRLKSPRTGRTHLPTALALARDVAAAMQYLHTQQVVHGDLKASNVLLKTAVPAPASPKPQTAAGSRVQGGGPGGGGGDGAGGGSSGGAGGSEEQAATISSGANLIQGGWVVAKICDFGLSSFLDTAGASTVLSTQICGGTLTHMAPELLTSAKPSKASDAYAFGILLYEVLTSERPYANIPHAMLGHAVVARRKRPAWLGLMGPEFLEAKRLAEDCWGANPQARPSFREVVERLQALHDAALAAAHAHSSTDSAGGGGGGSGGGAASCFLETCLQPAAPGPPAAPQAGGAEAPAGARLVSPFALVNAVAAREVAAGGGAANGGGKSEAAAGGRDAGSSAAPAAGACAVAHAPGAGGRAPNRSSLVGWF